MAGLSGAQLAAVAALWARTGREVTARFGGSSMEPTIAAGAEVVLRCGRAAAPGDVIAYVHGDQVVVHRLEVVRADVLLTRGDARVAPDPPLPADTAIVGTVALPGQVSLPAPPRSAARALALAACRAALFVHPRLCLLAVRALRRAERTLR